MTQIRRILVSICLSLFSLKAMACGGADLSDEKISALSFVQAVQFRIAAVYGEPVKIESIVRSGHEILNLDKQVVGNVRCSANYINVFFVSQASTELRCMTTFQVSSGGQLDLSGLRAGAECQQSKGAQREWIVADSRPVKWTCEVRDPHWPWPKKSEVLISLTEPTVVRIDFFPEKDGTYRPKNQELITKTLVSTYRAERSKCTIHNDFKKTPGVDSYDFIFECKGLYGRFSMNFREATGFYSERLTWTDSGKKFPLENCRPEP